MKSLIGRTVGVVAISLCLGGSLVHACSVPVFRYALERWPADDYEVVVLHRGALDAETQATLERLKAFKGANVQVQTKDLEDHPDGQLELDGEAAGKESVPRMRVRYPAATRLEATAWTAPFTPRSVAQLVDSSARREIANRLLAGDTAVFVFLEIGDPARDDPALQLLQSELANLQLQIQLPEIVQEDIDQGLLAADPLDLKVAFTTLRVSRDDPTEAALVASLLGSESDLRELDSPMVFPVFGRGRVLYALIGAGINPDTIAQACADVTGPCTCTVKEQNPGVDLLMAVDWDERVLDRIRNPVPPLAGIGEFTIAAVDLPESRMPSDSDMPSDLDMPSEKSDAPGSPSHLLSETLLLAAAVGCLTVVGLTLWILRRGQ